MQSKTPADFLRALSATAKRVFYNMRPSCRARYAKPVVNAANATRRKKRIASVVRAIAKYGNVHPRLKSKLYKKQHG